MRYVLFILAILVAVTGKTAFAAGAPAHLAASLSRQISSEGARAAAWQLTLDHGWLRVERDVATNNPALKAAELRALLDHTPRHEREAMQRALRARLQMNTLAGLAALSPVAHSPYSGGTVCGAGDAHWKHRLQPSLIAVHDITYALQREDCLKALHLHSRH
ncbi:hypothetical protein [Asaia astilbis]|uniref:hypothetical protein n=1 Tax=Asaia astilbis TaxID=610244 RepID=UPI0004719CCB|nr:hypothetical protein [Asaia astilbis]